MLSLYKELEKRIHEVSDINSAIAVLCWDQNVNLPPRGAASRADQLSTLSRIGHEKFTSDEIGTLLDKLTDYQTSLDKNSDEFCLLKNIKRNYDRKVKVPSKFIAEFSRVTTMGHQNWEIAKTKSDFSLFEPALEKIYSLKREYASFFKPFDNIYDPLLDEFEPGLKRSEVKEVFEKVRKVQVDLIKKISLCEETDDSFLKQHFPHKRQMEFSKQVITDFGYDWKSGRLDLSAHPFMTTLGNGDVRITTRVNLDFLSTAMFCTFHESGHAIYEQNIKESLHRSPLGSGGSCAVHESQSRLWENIIGRSHDFWNYYYQKLQTVFPEQLNLIDLDTFHKGINKVKPSLVRIEADEVTYNLHIILRMEIEIDLLEGKVKVKDLPEIWNQKMSDYLGVTPENDAQGILQDIHWSYGMVGYFPAYALGNIISSQIWETCNNEIPDLSEQIGNGKFSLLRNWLTDHLYCHGAKFDPQDIVQKITGDKINPDPYIRYITEKFSNLYEI